VIRSWQVFWLLATAVAINCFTVHRCPLAAQEVFSDHTGATSDRTPVFNDHTRAHIDRSPVFNDHTRANIDHRGVFNDHTRANIDHRPVFSMHSMVIDIHIDHNKGF
jgi:hypothetical protein